MNPQQARALASYNSWMNQRVYSLCATLTDEERKRDHHAFFHSIHGTLNHLLLADKVWLGRFVDEPFAVEGLDQELHDEFSALRSDRFVTDDRIGLWASTLTDSMLTEDLHYTGITQPVPRTCPLWIAVAHFFNHQTHHRGQLTTLLSQAGLDYGITDLIMLPDLFPEQNG